MFYIYKTTNLINGKFYIGKHSTKSLDNDYLGSGKLLKRAIEKYGRENFRKEIIEVCDTKEKMNLAERILVVIDQEVSYNLCPGGQGGFGYIRDNLPNGMLGKRQTIKHYEATQKYKGIPSNISDEGRIKISITNSLRGPTFKDKKHTEETKQKMSRNHNPRSHPVGVKRGPYKKRVNGRVA